MFRLWCIPSKPPGEFNRVCWIHLNRIPSMETTTIIDKSLYLRLKMNKSINCNTKRSLLGKCLLSGEGFLVVCQWLRWTCMFRTFGTTHNHTIVSQLAIVCQSDIDWGPPNYRHMAGWEWHWVNISQIFAGGRTVGLTLPLIFCSFSTLQMSWCSDTDRKIGWYQAGHDQELAWILDARRFHWA